MESPRPSRFPRRRALVLLVVAIFSLPIAALAVVVSTNIYFLEADVTAPEDVYVAASSARVFGTVDGDFIVAAGSVTIAGSITGDVFVASHGKVVIDGDVKGSVRGVAREVEVTGTVGGDVAVAAILIDVSGDVARDVLLLGGSLDVTGSVGRDVLGRVETASLDGDIGGDVDVLVTSLTLGSHLDARGDVIYRSSGDARVSQDATVAGSLSRLPGSASFIVRSILLFVTLLHFLSFLFAGLVLLWLFSPTASETVDQIARRPWRSLGVGLLTVVVVPVVVVLLVFSLVGIPVGLLLLGLLVLALFFAPIPAVTAVGIRLLRGRGGLMGAFVLGAVLWRSAIWLIPVIPLLIYLLSVLAGLGGFVLATFERRRAARAPSAVPLATVAAGGPPSRPVETGDDDWTPPLAPGAPPSTAEADEAVQDDDEDVGDEVDWEEDA